jgi:hypothetical protein
MRCIRLLFLRAAADDHWLNRLVSRLDPPFCHVELEFDMPQPVALSAAPTLATSLYAGEAVFLRPRTFANPNYTILTLSVSDAAFARMLRLATDTAERGVRFDSHAMCCAILPCPCSRLRADRTFCSAYVTALLQEGEVRGVERLVPERTRPSTLYHLLRSSQQQCFSSVPYKLNMLTAQPSHTLC